MNETNPLETQLRSWIPRRPSAGLERRLFHRPKRAPRPARSWSWNWLVPVTACLLFASLILNQHGAASGSATPRSGAMVALILSNQSYAAYLPGSFQRAVNRLDTFGWTNGGGSTSSMPSLSPFKAND
jgi:hypothetical protein